MPPRQKLTNQHPAVDYSYSAAEQRSVAYFHSGAHTGLAREFGISRETLYAYNRR